jgi:hypothetical protein
MKFSTIATIVVAAFAQSMFHFPHFLACAACEQIHFELIPPCHCFRILGLGALAAPSPEQPAARDALPAAEVRLCLPSLIFTLLDPCENR